jgi:hypothetical protein
MGDQAMDIDKQRIAAVRTLEALGYGYHGDQWVPRPRRRRRTPCMER